jgi:hypothetical protein
MAIDLSKDGVENRIKEAGDEYVDGEIDEDELEERIERALKMEFLYRELLCSNHFIRLPDGQSSRIFGRSVEPGESVRLDDIRDIDPLDCDVCPY